MGIAYRDERGIILPKLLTDEADKIAKDLADHAKAKKFSSAQLRRFYGEFKSLEQKFTFRKQKGLTTEEAFRSILPLVKMVKSKVAYASKKVPMSFKDWLTTHVDSINSGEDFEAFMLHFEAVVGFCYGYGMSNN